MVRRVVFVLVVVLSLLDLQECGRSRRVGNGIDLLAPVTLYNGRADTLLLDDLFFSEDYSSFTPLESAYLNVSYSQADHHLIIKPDREFWGFCSMKFNFRGRDYDMPVYVRRKIPHEFSLHGNFNTDTVYVFGNFNNWQREQYPLIYNQDKVLYSGSVDFDPGRWEYRFGINGRDKLDPDNPERVPNGLGDFNSFLLIPEYYTGKMPVLTPGTFRKLAGGKEEITVIVIANDARGQLNKSDVSIFLDNQLLSEKNYVFDNSRSLRLILEENQLNRDGVQHLKVMIANKKFKSNFLDILLVNGNLPDNSKQVWLWNDAVIYSIMTDRFSNGDDGNDMPVIHPDLADRANFQGGDLEGILQRIDEGYFRHLGVNTLWISPWYETTNNAFQETPKPHRWFAGYHGYWPVQPRTVEPRFGSNALLKTVVDTAHRQGLKILMDFISNDVHEEHPYFREHRDWFGQLDLPDGRKNLRLWDEYRLTTWFDPYIPSFDYEKSDEAMKTVISDAVWWMKEYKLDGFRHDAVKHVPNKFWRGLTKTLRTSFPKKDIYQIGETFGDYHLVSSYVNNGQLSAQFNFNQYWPARYCFAEDSADFGDLVTEMEKSIDIYGQLNLMANIMDSHDQPRLAAFLEKDLKWNEDAAEAGWARDIEVNRSSTYDKIAMYFVYLMSSPGIPVIYYGDEIGMTGAADPDNRRMMKWGEQVTAKESRLRTQVSQLVDLRNHHTALRYGDFIPLLATKKAFAYIRRDFQESILVVISKSKKSETVRIHFPEELRIKGAESLNGNPGLSMNGADLIVTARPWSGYMFRLLQEER